MSYHSRHCASGLFGNELSDACDCGQAERAAAHKPVEPTPSEREEGEQLASAGWRQVSRQYRRIVHVPDAGSAWAELERVAPAEAERLRPIIAEFVERTARAALWHCGETRELSPGTFAAFRAAHVRRMLQKESCHETR